MQVVHEHENTAPKAMLVSVGGSSAPVVKTIELNNPEKIIFFASRDSYKSVSAEILPEIMKITGQLPQHEIIITPDEQDVGKSTFALLSGVSDAMTKLGVNNKWPVLVDFTGGTKVMSAALVWASSRYPCRFSYIGGSAPDARTKNGLGIVIDGKERRLLIENPWNEIAYFDVQAAATMFNTGQYTNAVSGLKNIVQRVTEPQRLRLLQLLLGLWRGYAEWDRFNHKAAISEFSKSTQPLLDIAPREEALWPGLLNFAEASNQCYEFLKNIQTKPPDKLSWNKIFDLLANAQRRASFENKYEDATARCYAAIEKYAKHALQLRHGIDNSSCKPEQLPETLRAEYMQRYTKETHQPLMQFGLRASFKLLIHLADPIGKRYEENKEELEKLLTLRNNSILGHGTTPISADNFERLFHVSLQVMAIDKSSLVVFPRI